MGSILLGDLEEQLPGAVDLSTHEGREKAAAGRLSVLMMVMVTRSLHESAATDDDPHGSIEGPIPLSRDGVARASIPTVVRRQRA